jgi:hypothetical protein
VDEFVFSRTYQMAGVVESSVNYPQTLKEIAWNEPSVQNALYIPNKVTILHHYIYSTLSLYNREDFQGNAEFYEEDAKQIEQLESELRAYGISFAPYAEYQLLEGQDSDETSRFYSWYESEEDSFDQLWDKASDEIFHWLYGNRSFLLKFNVALAALIRDGEIEVFP